MKKKKFFQTDVGKILKGAASIVAPGLVNALEGVSSVGEAVNIIKGSQVDEETKLKLLEIAQQSEEQITRRLESDNKQELWLPKLVRPLTLVALVIAYITGFFLQYDVSVLHTPLITVFSFYFGGRSVEKLLNKHY